MIMLSSQPSMSPVHKRQNSVATTSLMDMEAPFSPDACQSFDHHRRGLSLDRSMAHQNANHRKSGNGTVSTNTGFNSQHILREAQMQDATRPGHQNLSQLDAMDRNLLVAVLQNAGQDQAPDETVLSDIKSGYLNVGEPLPKHLDGHGIAAHDAENAVFIKNDLKIETAQPRTPTKHIVAAAYPLTPMTGPRHAHSTSFPHSVRMEDDVFKAPSTPDPTPMKRSSSHQEVLTARRPLSSHLNIPPTPQTAPPMQYPNPFGLDQVPTAALLDISTLNMDFASGYDSSKYSPMTCRTSPVESSLQSSPELRPVSLFGEINTHYQHFPAFQQDAMCESPTSGRGHSLKKKSLQMPEDTIIAETGISNDEVEAFIQGPDPVTKEYTCLYQNCKFKPFARKENIRSHIQTHLGDRKFVCGTCKSRFVRPNDLKRHAVIHQTSRDFVCICGAAFGRKDALRRHKLRNEKCALDEPSLQVLKKEEKKRGRPRKVVPTETAERRDRKERIRKAVMSKQREGSVTSSAAASYPSSVTDHNSPEAMDIQPVIQDYSPSMEMAFTPPSSPEDVILINPCLTLQQPQPTGSSANLSPPPTRGSMSAGIGATSPLSPAHSNVHGLELSCTKHFGSDTFGLSITASQSQTSSINCESPPSLDQFSSSPEPSCFRSSTTTFTDFQQQLSAEATSFEDFTFGQSRMGPDDMFPLFGDNDSASPLDKSQDLLQDLEDTSQDDSFWEKL